MLKNVNSLLELEDDSDEILINPLSEEIIKKFVPSVFCGSVISIIGIKQKMFEN